MRVLRTPVGHGPAAVRNARAHAREQLTGRVPADGVDDAVLLVSELVTNANLHVGGPVFVGLTITASQVRIEVEDTSQRLPVRRRVLNPERVSGRGLHLVELLSRDWGFEREPGGKVVWCELALTADA